MRSSDLHALFRVLGIVLGVAIAVALFSQLTRTGDAPTASGDLPPSPLIDFVVKQLREQGQDDPSAADIVEFLNILTVSVSQNAGHDEAIALAQKAKAYAERTLGPGHAHTLASANNLAGMYTNKGLYEDAERLYKQALEASELLLGL